MSFSVLVAVSVFPLPISVIRRLTASTDPTKSAVVSSGAGEINTLNTGKS